MDEEQMWKDFYRKVVEEKQQRDEQHPDQAIRENRWTTCRFPLTQL